MQGVDLELFRDIPGYKAILKAVLKSQIQVLVEQLALQTGEESVLITACIEEGTLSHLGSDIGKVFMDSQDDIKSRFLGFCLKRYQIKKQTGFFVGAGKRRNQTIRKRPAAPQIQHRNMHRNIQPINQKQRNLNLTKQSRKIKSNKPNIDNLLQNIQNNVTPIESDNVTAENYSLKSEPNPSDVGYIQTQTENQSFMSESNQMSNVIQNDMFLSRKQVKSKQEIKNEALTDDQSNGIETGAQSLYTGSEGENQSSSFVVVTEEGENVFEGQVEANGTNEIKDTSAGELVPLEEQTAEDLSIYLNSDPSFALDDSDEVGSSLQVLEKIPKRSRCKSRKSIGCKKVKTGSVKSDGDDRPYPCTLCPKRFKERHHLTYHLRTHSGHRPYSCDICNKSFTQTSSLNTHRKLHLKQINCGMCGRKFKKAADFSQHVCYTTEQLDLSQ